MKTPKLDYWVRQDLLVRFWSSRKDFMTRLYCSIVVRLDVSKMSPNRATIDHIVPRSRGGTYHDNNLAVACYTCNVEKSDMTLEEFIRKRQKVS